ncbi:hypothetical protein [Sphaerisporangium rubeum]|uniref:ABC transporter permease n=1 Tax=Sphaerisporangium rubeum TaxID=321317 RepID=A0A7X0IBQ0_9ACTN|nr:hypothetical protein [Sphaerisporangium rubeum]MBB6471549.1 hypothetical protein [Sphaerisporangium rubeum]
MKKIIGAVLAATVLGMLFVASFLGAFRAPEPHHVPVGVVGPQAVAGQMAAALTKARPGAFDLTAYPTAAAARTALLDREVDGVIDPAAAKLTVASAAGRTSATVLTTVFQNVAKAQGRTLTVEDAVPLPAGDSGGIAGMFYALALVLPAIAMAVILSRAAPGLTAPARAGVLLAGAVTAALGNAFLAGTVLGALPGAFPGLTLASAAIVLTIALVVAGLLRVAGPAGAGLAALLFIPIGLPASGGPLGAHFVPEWYAAIGGLLPVGPGGDLIRNVVHFDGAAVTGPLAVLAFWAAAGAVLLTVPGRRTTPAPAPAPVAVPAA